MALVEVLQPQQTQKVSRSVALGLFAIFLTQFFNFTFINARNIAQPEIIAEFNGMALFSWLIALPALSGAASTLLFGKLSDIYGRRTLLLICIIIFLIGLGICASSTTMIVMIIATTLMSIGHFPIMPMVFSVIGDLFTSADRAKWTGLLNLPSGIAAIIGPVLGGIVAESVFGWRGLYWGSIPLMGIATMLVYFGLPNTAQKIKPKIDVTGTLVMILATSSLIFGFSWLGDSQLRWLSFILLFISIIAWYVFTKVETKADAPILDPQIFHNRTFMTAAAAALLSFFGMLGIAAYSPIFVQDVMKINPSLSGTMLTPYSALVALLGIPAGFVLAKTKKYKWMYIAGYSVVTLALFAMWQMTAHTPVWLYILITTIAGLGIGAIPTINTLVAQYAVPKRLLGVAIGAIFFFQMVGIAVAPAILGLAQSAAVDLESGLQNIFLVGALTMTLSLILTITIPQIPIDTESAD
jgi:MFS family permease